MNRAVVFGVALWAVPPALVAQQGAVKLRVSVADFEYEGVRQSVGEVFGSDVDIGQGIADLVSQHLAKSGRYAVGSRTTVAAEGRGEPSGSTALAQGDVDFVIAGSVTAYGKQQAQTAGVNVRLGRVGLGGIGRQQTTAYVVITARFIGPSGALATVPVAMGEGDASGSGTSLLGGMSVAGISAGGQVNLSGQEYAKTTIGQATLKAVGAIGGQLDGMYAQVLASRTPAAPPTAPAVASPAPVVAVASPAVVGAPISGPFTWGMYQFKGTEHFKYDAVSADGNERQQGWYTLDAQPANNGMFRLTVAGQLGTDSFRSSSTVSPGQGIPFMQLASMGPGALILFSPMYGMFGGQQWQIGNEWSFSQEGETASFKVEEACSHAGVSGLRGVWRKNTQVMLDMCVAPEVALPLAVTVNDGDGGQVQEMKLVEYRP